MRFSSRELSTSPPATPPLPRRKHRRRVPPSPSATSKDRRDRSSSPPHSMSSDGDGGSEANLEPNVTETELSSYSASRSVYQSDSLRESPLPPSSLPTTAYVNVAPLPVFRGEPSECPVAHLSRFDRVCRANNATTVETLLRIFPVTLDGDAALWYDLSVEPRRPSMSWDSIRTAFLEAFVRPDLPDRARAELISIRQREGEGVNSYHLRLQWILKKWPDHGFPDALLRGIFVDGLREDYQDWVLPQRPDTLAGAVRLAMSWEQARRAREARKGVEGSGEAKCGFCGGEHEESGCEVKRRMKDLWLRSKEEGASPATAAAAAVLSPAMSLVRRGEGGEVVMAMGRTESMRRGGGMQCQCWKHQCWKKYERSNTVTTSATAEGNATSNGERASESPTKAP